MVVGDGGESASIVKLKATAEQQDFNQKFHFGYILDFALWKVVGLATGGSLGIAGKVALAVRDKAPCKYDVSIF